MNIKKPFLFIFNLLLFMIITPIKFISRWILKSEIDDRRKSNNEITSILHNKISEITKERDFITKENNKIKTSINRLKEAKKDNVNEIFELATTKNDEIVIISYLKDNPFDCMKLYSGNGTNRFADTYINLDRYGGKVKIGDFISKIKNQGYGRTLMDFLIIKAKEERVSIITGDLAPTDSDSFNRLIPFYESFGFECVLFEKDKKINGMLGEIKLLLKEN